MKFDAEVKREILLMAVGCAICSAVVCAVFAVLGYFDLTVLVGAAVGFLLAFGNFFFMSVGIINAIATGDENTAKLKMRSSYTGRTIVMLLIMAASILIEGIHWLPVVLSVFYPRIVITVKNLVSMFVMKKNMPVSDENCVGEMSEGSASLENEIEPDTEEDADEFEKFVSGFSKGSVPGERKTDGGDHNSNNK